VYFRGGEKGNPNKSAAFSALKNASIPVGMKALIRKENVQHTA
jgi:hypothetical protein